MPAQTPQPEEAPKLARLTMTGAAYQFMEDHRGLFRPERSVRLLPGTIISDIEVETSRAIKVVPEPDEEMPVLTLAYPDMKELTATGQKATSDAPFFGNLLTAVITEYNYRRHPASIENLAIYCVEVSGGQHARGINILGNQPATPRLTVVTAPVREF